MTDDAYILEAVSFLTCICTAFINFDFMKKIKVNIYRSTYAYRIAAIIYIIALWIFNLISYPVGKTIIMCVLNGIIGHFMFNKDRLYIAFYVFLGLCIGVCEFISVPIFQTAFQWTGYFEYKSIWFISIMLVMSQIVVFTVYRIFIELFKTREIKLLTRVQVFNFILLPVFSFINILIMLSVTQYIMYPAVTVMVVINIVFVLFLNFYLTYLFQTISQNNMLKNEIALYEQKSNMQYEYYNSLEKKYESSRKVIHDMKNHMQSMESLYEIRQYDKAKEYGKSITELLDSMKKDYYCSSAILNVIINDKVELAREYGIEVSCRINDINLDFMEEIDVTAIFANLFDNAIEASKDVKDNPYIGLKADKIQEFIVISIINSCAQRNIEDEKGSLPVKKNHEGLGLGNVKMALEKYDGNMRVEKEKGKFKVTLFIPI